jgi:hypothetical protein
MAANAEALAHLQKLIDMPMDESAKKALMSPPFLQIEGVINARVVGGYASSLKPGYKVIDKLCVRSGELTYITETGKKALKAFGVTKVFDLRVDFELAKYKAAPPKIDGVEIIRPRPSGEEDWDKMDFASM